MKLMLKGGRVIDPSQHIDAVLDIVIENGKIVQLGKNLAGSADDSQPMEFLNVHDTIITPGLIDMHTHLREPGHEYKETIKTGCTAAVAGGFTSIACMPNTSPVNDNGSVTEFILNQAKLAGMANVYPIAAISKGSEGKILTEFGNLKATGAVALSDDGMPVMNTRLMRSALEYAHSLGMSIINHCEDLNLSKGGLMNEGLISTELGLKGVPSIAEDIMVMRDIALAEYTKTSVHIAHVSTAGAIHSIRKAKERGIQVTAETAPHYFSLTEDALRGFSTNYKVNPPLRGKKDVEAVKQGLKDGTIDVISSDHAPHSSIEKDVEFEYASSGIIGLETSLPLGLKLVDEGILTLNQLFEKMSTAPARILNIKKGTLQTGADADMTIIDTKKEWTIDVTGFHSKSSNTPFDGLHVKGKAIMTIVGGTIKYQDSNKAS